MLILGPVNALQWQYKGPASSGPIEGPFWEDKFFFNWEGYTFVTWENW